MKKAAWFVFYILLLLSLAALVYFVIIPVYKSPENRTWSSSIGYPAMLRALGQPIPITIGTAEQRDFELVISAEGLMDYLNEVSVNVEVAGIVSQLDVHYGDKVAKGDVLLTIDTGGHRSRIAKLDLDLKESLQQKAKIDFDRERRAFKNGLISLTEFEEYKNEYDKAKISAQKARETFRDSIQSMSSKAMSSQLDELSADNQFKLDILSPADGRVINVKTYVGENFVRSEKGVMLLGSDLVFRAAFDQLYYGDLNVGDTLEIRLRAFPDSVFNGKIARIAPTVSSMSSKSSKSGQPPLTFLVWIEMDIDGLKFASGMNGYCIWKKSLRSLAIPSRALIRYSGGQGMVMLLKDDDTVELLKVDYSIKSNGWVAISSGLAEGDQIVLSGFSGLNPGDEIVY